MNILSSHIPKVFITCSLEGFAPIFKSLGIDQPYVDPDKKTGLDDEVPACLIFKQECKILGAHIFSDSYLKNVEPGCKQLQNISYCSNSDDDLSIASKNLLSDYRLESIAQSDFIICYKWDEQFSKDELMELSFAVSLDKLVVIVKSPGVLVPERLKNSKHCSIIIDRDELRGLKTGFLTGFSCLE